MLSAMQQGMKRSSSVESFAEPEGSGGSGLSVSRRLRTGVRRHVFDKDAKMHTKYVLQDKVERPQFVKKIALSYVISAALIAVLCLTGQIIVQVYESRTHTDGRYVNTAGKSRLPPSNLPARGHFAVAQGCDHAGTVNKLQQGHSAVSRISQTLIAIDMEVCLTGWRTIADGPLQVHIQSKHSEAYVENGDQRMWSALLIGAASCDFSLAPSPSTSF